MSPELPQPWAAFLRELDALLEQETRLHCLGGFAAVAAYGLPRATADLDYYSLTPYDRLGDLQRIAGEGSRLARKHKVHFHHAAVAVVPENYEERLSELFPGEFKCIRLFVFDPYDLVLSKLSRNLPRDREDVEYLARTQLLDPAILQQRYERELRVNLIGPPERHDQTLKFWLEAYFSPSGN
jgi:hypothetical protein